MYYILNHFFKKCNTRHSNCQKRFCCWHSKRCGIRGNALQATGMHLVCPPKQSPIARPRERWRGETLVISLLPVKRVLFLRVLAPAIYVISKQGYARLWLRVICKVIFKRVNNADMPLRADATSAVILISWWQLSVSNRGSSEFEYVLILSTRANTAKDPALAYIEHNKTHPVLPPKDHGSQPPIRCHSWIIRSTKYLHLCDRTSWAIFQETIYSWTVDGYFMCCCSPSPRLVFELLPR